MGPDPQSPVGTNKLVFGMIYKGKIYYSQAILVYPGPGSYPGQTIPGGITSVMRAVKVVESSTRETERDE